jgi:predicted nucleic acid-binding protein
LYSSKSRPLGVAVPEALGRGLKPSFLGHLHLLHQLYGTVLIPEAVYRELTDPSFPVAGAAEVRTLVWIQTRAVSNRTLVEALSNELDIGEAEAIALAVEVQAKQILMNERRGRLVATRLNLRPTGILGILVEAKNRGLVAKVKPLLDALVNEAGFWVAEPLYNRVLQLVHEIDSV